MNPNALNPRLALRVRLALSPNYEAAVHAASRVGLAWAETDAAREGRSFDVQAQAAIVPALALRAGGATDARDARLSGLVCASPNSRLSPRWRERAEPMPRFLFFRRKRHRFLHDIFAGLAENQTVDAISWMSLL